MVKVHFSDFFQVDPNVLESYGAFNISVINDLPLFVDPFLLFSSEKPKYQALHEEMIEYLRFLRDKSDRNTIRPGLLRAWYRFPEIKQNWLGYSLVGNQGSGLGMSFALAMRSNLTSIFSNLGDEQITRGSHLEKLCLIESGVGRDNISDFTTNLILHFLLEYTQTFAQRHIDASLRKVYNVRKVKFNFHTQSWESRGYELPSLGGDFVILTPKDILTKDEGWINKHDLYAEFDTVLNSLPNDELRDQLNNYLFQVLSEKSKEKERRDAIQNAIREFPEFIEHYIRFKEDIGDQARVVSDQKVDETERLFIKNINLLVSRLYETDFYAVTGETKEETRLRVEYLKDNIENKGGWRIFYVDGKPVRRESDIHIMFRLTWFATPSDVSREVDDGRGPADFKVSRGRWDKTIIEFKLAQNRQLKRNLEKQAEIYQAASEAEAGLKVIVYFNDTEFARVENILNEIGLLGNPDIVLIDAAPKPSASTV